MELNRLSFFQSQRDGHRRPFARLRQAGDDTAYRDSGLAHEPAELLGPRMAVEERQRPTVDHRGKNQQRAHHPAQARRPGDDIPGLDVLIEEAVGRGLDRWGLRPSDSLGSPVVPEEKRTMV